MTSKEKAKDALPLKGVVSSKPAAQQAKSYAATVNVADIEDVI